MRTLHSLLTIACMLMFAGCTTNEPTVSLAPTALQTPLVITERQKVPCEVPEPKVGQDKVQYATSIAVELDDCEAKRAALQGTLEKENVKRKASNAKTVKTLEGDKKS